MTPDHTVNQDICFIYPDGTPTPRHEGLVSGRVQYLPIASLQRNLLHEDAACRLVLFPLNEEQPVLHKEIRTIFPRAEFVSYSNLADPAIESRSRDLGFSLHVHWPVSGSLLAYLRAHNAPLIERVGHRLAGQSSYSDKILALYEELAGTLDLTKQKDDIYREFCLIGSRLLECANFCAFSLDRETSRWRLLQAVHPLVSPAGGDWPPPMADLLQHALNTDRPAKTNQPLPGRFRSLLAHPFHCRGGKRGLFLAVDKRADAGFGDQDTEFLQHLTHPFGLIHESLVSQERAERLTITDDLTNLYNIRYLRQYLGFEVKRTLRYGKHLALLFIDVDDFKTVNDRHGHLVGSSVLCELGRSFAQQVRDSDVIVRYGGDEFVIILAETPLDGAWSIAERLRQQVADHLFSGGRNLDLRLTISIGISVCPEHASTAEDLLQLADSAMYAAKHLSKNTIQISR